MKYETHQPAARRLARHTVARVEKVGSGLGSTAVPPILHMQRAIGNQGVQRMLQASPDVLSPGGAPHRDDDSAGHTVRTMPASTTALTPGTAPHKPDEDTQHPLQRAGLSEPAAHEPTAVAAAGGAGPAGGSAQTEPQQTEA